MKRRKLPAWMTGLHEQSKAKATSEDTVTDVKSERVAASYENENKVKVSSFKRKIASKSQSSVSVSQVESISASEFISNSMPFLKVPGKVTYTYQLADCACICEEILSSLTRESKITVGFDMEWPVSYKRGGMDKTALIQMYFGNLDKCYLFQVSGMSCLPQQLAKLICHEALILVGLNIDNDLWKLNRDFDVVVRPLFDRGSVIDVGQLANKKLKSSERWDLNGLCKNVLSSQLNKEHDIRCGNWADIPLSQEQINYSSSDAYAGFAVYQKLISM